tara:strand:+ start:735 stop:1136 length:402 start_codon:yes stop_codon:yes gene_type:complete
MCRNQDCPCESGKTYNDCCEVAHSGKLLATTAEALMRSRFSAYVFGIADYIVKTTHPKFREKNFKVQIENWMNQSRWTHLEVLEVVGGLNEDECGEVEFIAEFYLDGQYQILHERSNFVRYKGRWVYTEGRIS